MELWWAGAVRRRVSSGRRRLLVANVAGALWSVAALPVMASSPPTSVSVFGGPLGATAPAVNGFTVVVLDGTAQVAHAPLQPFSVIDARGSGQGWTLTLQATQFREWDGDAYVPDGKSLPLGSLGLAGMSVTAEGTDSDAPAVSAGPYTLDGRAVAVATAPVGTGMGTFAFEPSSSMTVAVPAHAYARTYRSELSVSLASGP